jgi:hypothetical protein
MPTTLVYEAQKAAIEERLRQAQFRHQPPRSSRPQPHSTATSRPARRRPPRAMVGLLGLAGAIAVSLLAFASSALAALPSNCRQTQHRGDVRVRVHGPRAGVHGAKRGRQRAGRCPRRGRRRRRSDHAGRHRRCRGRTGLGQPRRGALHRVWRRRQPSGLGQSTSAGSTQVIAFVVLDPHDRGSRLAREESIWATPVSEQSD